MSKKFRIIVVAIAISFIVSLSLSNAGQDLFQLSPKSPKNHITDVAKPINIVEVENNQPEPLKQDNKVAEKSYVAEKIKIIDGMYIELTHDCEIEVEQESVDMLQQALLYLNDGNDYEVMTFNVSKHLTLKVISPDIPPKFWKRIVGKIEFVLKKYKQWFELELTEPRTINVIAISGWGAYQDFITSLQIHSPNSAGLYMQNTNVSIVSYNDPATLMSTVIHESIHRVNHMLIGRMSRAMNEGLAEFFENLIGQKKREYDQSGRFIDNNGETIMNIADIFISENQWSTDIRRQLYHSAFMLMNYLEEVPGGLFTLKQLLNQEQKNKCNVIGDYGYKLQSFSDNSDLTFGDWQYLQESKAAKQ